MGSRTRALGSLVALGLVLTGCEQPGTTVTNNVSGTPDAGADEPGVANMTGTAAPAAAPRSAAEFISAVAASDQFEIESGKLAQEKGQSDRIRGFGAMLVEHHTKAQEEFRQLLAQSNPPVTPPATLPPELQAKLGELAALGGPEFDQRWLAEQTAAHQRTLATLNGFLAVAPPGPLKDHAAKATGIVQQHLNEFNQGR